MKYDSIIIGAGILGLATAYHIKKLCPEDRVLVLDSLNSSGQGNTAKSAGMFRNFFYSSTNYDLADSSINFYKNLQDNGADLNIKWTGYLWLFSDEEYIRLKPSLVKLANIGLDYKIFDKEELISLLPIRTDVKNDVDSKEMGLSNVDKGVFSGKAGSIDVNMLLNYYETKFKEAGGEIKYNTKVENILITPNIPLEIPGEPYFWQNPQASGVKTNKGKIEADKIIVCAGSWAPLLLDKIGINCFTKARKRQIFSIKVDTPELKQLLYIEGFNKEGCLPFTVLPNPKVYLKPALEEEAFWLCYADDFPREFKIEDDPQSERNFYDYGIYQVVIKYFKQFIGKKPFSSFAGQYAMNTIDGQPLIFNQNNILIVGGASGSGIIKADAIGRIAASLYAKKKYATLFGGKKFKISNLGIKKRKVIKERIVI